MSRFNESRHASSSSRARSTRSCKHGARVGRTSTSSGCRARGSSRAAARALARDASATTRIVALGAVIRGETPHFDFVAGEAARGLADASAEFDVPIGFGLLTTDTMEQAEARAGGAHGNKGWDAALAALEMVGPVRAAAMARTRVETRARARALQALYAWDMRGGRRARARRRRRSGTISRSRPDERALRAARSCARSSPTAAAARSRDLARRHDELAPRAHRRHRALRAAAWRRRAGARRHAAARRDPGSGDARRAVRQRRRARAS